MPVLVAVDVQEPPLLVHLHDPAHDDVADVGPVALFEGSDTNDPINLMNYAGHTRINQLAILAPGSLLVSAVARNKALANVVTWQHNFFHGCFFFLLALVYFEIFGIFKLILCTCCCATSTCTDHINVGDVSSILFFQVHFCQKL